MQVDLAPSRRLTKKMAVSFPKAGVLLLDESTLSDHECAPFFRLLPLPYSVPQRRNGNNHSDHMSARTEGALRMVTDQVLSPTFTADLVQKTKELIEKDVEGLFHLTNAGECSWFEFARGALELAGVEAKMEEISSASGQLF